MFTLWIIHSLVMVSDCLRLLQYLKRYNKNFKKIRRVKLWPKSFTMWLHSIWDFFRIVFCGFWQCHRCFYRRTLSSWLRNKIHRKITELHIAFIPTDQYIRIQLEYIFLDLKIIPNYETHLYNYNLSFIHSIIQHKRKFISL